MLYIRSHVPPRIPGPPLLLCHISDGRRPVELETLTGLLGCFPWHDCVSITMWWLMFIIFSPVLYQVWRICEISVSSVDVFVKTWTNSVRHDRCPPGEIMDGWTSSVVFEANHSRKVIFPFLLTNLSSPLTRFVLGLILRCCSLFRQMCWILNRARTWFSQRWSKASACVSLSTCASTKWSQLIGSGCDSASTNLICTRGQ